MTTQTTTTSETGEKQYRSIEEFRKAFFPEESTHALPKTDSPEEFGKQLARESLNKLRQQMQKH